MHIYKYKILMTQKLKIGIILTLNLVFSLPNLHSNFFIETKVDRKLIFTTYFRNLFAIIANMNINFRGRNGKFDSKSRPF